MQRDCLRSGSMHFQLEVAVLVLPLSRVVNVRFVFEHVALVLPAALPVRLRAALGRGLLSVGKRVLELVKLQANLLRLEKLAIEMSFLCAELLDSCCQNSETENHLRVMSSISRIRLIRV